MRNTKRIQRILNKNNRLIVYLIWILLNEKKNTPSMSAIELNAIRDYKDLIMSANRELINKLTS